MKANNFQLNGQEYIELNKLLKLLQWVETGGEANEAISAGQVKVNGLSERRKRHKIRVGYRMEYEGRVVLIIS